MIAARLILSNGMVIDLVGSVELHMHPGYGNSSDLFGDDRVFDHCAHRALARLDLNLSSTDFTIYDRAEDAPRTNNKLRALPSGADRLPLERVDGEILPED